MAETTKIKAGKYYKETEVEIEITETKVIEETRTTTVSEDIILKTIEVLKAKKTVIVAQIDAEIAENNAMLEKVRAIDRSKSLTEEEKEEPIIKQTIK